MISHDHLTEEILENDRVCEKHFVSGRAAKSWDKYNIDWVPTLFLGHKKATDRADHKEAAAKRSERARERELVRKPYLLLSYLRTCNTYRTYTKIRLQGNH